MTTLYLITFAVHVCIPILIHVLSPSDIDKIHDGIGDKIALLIQWLSTFFGGFIVGFVREWRLTLLLLALSPFLALGGAVMAKVRP